MNGPRIEFVDEPEQPPTRQQLGELALDAAEHDYGANKANREFVYPRLARASVHLLAALVREVQTLNGRMEALTGVLGDIAESADVLAELSREQATDRPAGPDA